MLDDNEGIEEEINSLFEAARRERYVHSRSEETFDAIAGLWFLGDAFRSVLARISCNYIVSSFLLRSLALIYKRISSNYDLPEFDARDLANDKARRRFTEEDIKGLKADATFVQWLQDFLLPKCVDLLLYVEGGNLEDIGRLGNLADSITRVAQQYVSHENGDTWVYDSIFQFSDELLPSSGESVVFGEAAASTLSEPRDNAWSLNNSFTFDPVISETQNAPQHEVLPGGSATNSDQEFRAAA